MRPSPPALLTLDLETAIKSLLERRLSDGGFTEFPGGDFRSDATAWAVIYLNTTHVYPQVAAAARARLAAAQLPNGGFPLFPDHPEAYWPTAAVTLALHNVPQYSAAHDRAIDFLLASSGSCFPREPDSPIGYDTTIPGWAWIEQTHSWVEPTALAIHALALAGESQHVRVNAGVRLLLDRQLPDGGWNFGSTTIFGKLHPSQPAPTGVALWALAGLTAREKIAPSLRLLEQQLPELYTPLSLGWALHGLAAWGAEKIDRNELIANCLRRQNRHSPYATSQLAILLLAATALPTARGTDA